MSSPVCHNQTVYTEPQNYQSFGLRARPEAATKEMVDTAEKVVYALVNAKEFFSIGFGGDRSRGREFREVNSMLNSFVDFVEKGKIANLQYVETNCQNLAWHTDAPKGLINKFANFSGYSLDWNSDSSRVFKIAKIAPKNIE